MGTVVHRLELGASKPSGSGRRKKGGADEPADHALGRSRGGFGTKVHLVTDGRGLPLAALASPGQHQELGYAEELLGTIRIRQRRGRPRCRAAALAGDRGYSARRFYRYLRRRGIEPVIPQRRRPRGYRPRRGRPRTFNRVKYRGRNVIERSVGCLKERRHLATRYDKLACNYLAMIKLAIILRYVKRLSDTA